MASVIVFSTDACMMCEHAKTLLTKRGVPFEEINLADSPALQKDLSAITGRTDFPQILVDNAPLGGLNELRTAERDGTMATWVSA